MLDKTFYKLNKAIKELEKTNILTEENKCLKKHLEDLLEELKDRENEIKRLKEEELVLRRNSFMYYSKKTYTATEMAHELGFKKAQELNQILANKGYQTREGTNEWFLIDKLSPYNFVVYRELDKVEGKYTRRFTEKGRQWLLNLFKDR